MALPIGATPILRGKHAVEFMAMIQSDARVPAVLTPTPKLGKACELIKEHAERQQKRIHR